MPKKWPHPLVAVTWEDAHGSGAGAYELHEIPHAPILVTTYGLLLREDEAGVTLSNEHYADSTYRGVTFIPSKMITLISVIKGTRSLVSRH